MVSFRLHILIPLPHHYIYISPFSFLPNYSTIVFVALPAPCQIIHDADNNMEEYNKNTKCNITLLNLPRLYFPMTNRLIFHPPRQQYPITNYCLCRQWYHSLAHFDTIATPLYIYFPFFLFTELFNYYICCVARTVPNHTRCGQQYGRVYRNFLYVIQQTNHIKHQTKAFFHFGIFIK